MARRKWFSYLLNDEGQPIEGANISIYLAGTSDPATIYTNETGSGTLNSDPQLITNKDGYFEFWVGDSTDPNGYPSTQKFKISYNKSGVVAGYNDYLSIFPSFIEVDETGTSTVKDKTVSNNLARLWEEHRTNDSYEVHGIEFVNVASTDTIKNRIVSNFLAKGWEDHKNLDYWEGPHNIYQVNENDDNTDKNKLVSNYTIKNLQDQIDGTTFTEIVSAGSLSTSGDCYYADTEHNLDDEYPIVNTYQISNNERLLPKDVISLDSNTVRVFFSEQTDFVVKINK